jgi:hypothetical protein
MRVVKINVCIRENDVNEIERQEPILRIIITAIMWVQIRRLTGASLILPTFENTSPKVTTINTILESDNLS